MNAASYTTQQVTNAVNDRARVLVQRGFAAHFAKRLRLLQVGFIVEATPPRVEMRNASNKLAAR